MLSLTCAACHPFILYATPFLWPCAEKMLAGDIDGVMKIMDVLGNGQVHVWRQLPPYALSYLSYLSLSLFHGRARQRPGTYTQQMAADGETLPCPALLLARPFKLHSSLPPSHYMII